MSKTYTVKLAEAIEARLNEGHPFTIDGDAEYWDGYIIVKHPVAGEVVIQPWAPDMRKAPTPKAIAEAMEVIGWRLVPQPGFTPEWRGKYRTAHNDWLTATAVDALPAGANALYTNADGSIGLVVLGSDDTVLRDVKRVTEDQMQAIFAGETEYRTVGGEVEVGDGDVFTRLEVR